jgi:hypothetical protein
MSFQGPDSNTSESTGKITDVLTEPGRQADRNVQASEDRPRYEVSHLIYFLFCSVTSSSTKTSRTD